MGMDGHQHTTAASSHDKSERPKLLKIKEHLRLANLGITTAQATWSRVRMSADNWLCSRHDRCAPPSRQESLSDDYEVVRSNHNATSVITLCSCHTNEVHTFEKQNVTSAQMNPSRPLLAISTCSRISIYDIYSEKLVSWARFPCESLFWCWISEKIIAVVSPTSIFHWNVDQAEEMSFAFERDSRTREHQVANYVADASLRWFAITSLSRSDKNAEVISGVAQIFSSDYGLSNCIEASAVSFVTYRIAGNASDSLFLIVTKKPKLSIVGLGAQQANHQSALTVRIEQMPWSDVKCQGSWDFPVRIVTSVELSLVYIVTKFGVLFVHDLETAAFILVQRISADIIFEATLDSNTQGLLAVTRGGQVLHVELEFPAVPNHLASANKKSLAIRLTKLKLDSLGEEVTRL